MQKQLKYNIDDFYVGELYLSYRFGNVLYNEKLTEQEKKDREKIIIICMNGAIKIEQSLLSSYIDTEKRRAYEGALTIFYKKGNQFISLHNGVSYDENGYDFYEHLTPLSKILPDIDFHKPQFITFKEACLFFKMLFDKTSSKNIHGLYISNQHRIENFYIGNLHLYEGFLPCSDMRERYIHYNLPQKYILSKSCAILGTLSSKIDFLQGREGRATYNYADYRCLFYDNQGELYNVHNYQTYNHKDSADRSGLAIDQSFCSKLMPLEQSLQKIDTKNKMKVLTIQEALRIYKKSK